MTDTIAVSGCFDTRHVAEFAATHKIGAIIDLREEACDDPQVMRGASIDFLHLPTPDLHPSTIDRLDEGVCFARDRLHRGQRILIHCMHGIGRSPLLALCVMVDQGMAPLDALRQAKDRRVQVSPSEAQYLGWAAWLKRRGYRSPSYHEFGCIAYRHLAQA